MDFSATISTWSDPMDRVAPEPVCKPTTLVGPGRACRITRRADKRTRAPSETTSKSVRNVPYQVQFSGLLVDSDLLAQSDKIEDIDSVLIWKFGQIKQLSGVGSKAVVRHGRRE
ncbi:hypothetical protein [Sinorhizobium sp. BG8]|uniref:hypothetical protein n=1 Tax=Sinorhizobium sp. BG8 TaxID=2613773 RepID=UPI00193EB2D8|nr:hypothetical protein [Sinorhizobium sp. BG8]QRM55396.1 hypothetical protein F3Y30_13315 [Sinorhizobium sp. BG8]